MDISFAQPRYEISFCSHRVFSIIRQNFLSEVFKELVSYDSINIVILTSNNFPSKFLEINTEQFEWTARSKN